MMPNGQKGVSTGTLVVLPAVVAWALVAVGVVVRRPGLDTCRPEARAFSERPAVGDETLPARLWQDPLETAYGAYDRLVSSEEGKPAPVSAPLDASTVALRIAERQFRGERILVLPVFISGETYSEDAENRLRTRYAVLSALSTAGYIPEDRNHIGYFTMDYPEQERGSDAKQAGGQQARKTTRRKFIIPFEWYEGSPLMQSPDERAECGFPEHVLVLWIDEGRLGDEPLKTLGAIVCQLRSRTERGHPGVRWLAAASEICRRPGSWWTLAKAVVMCAVEANPSVRVIGPTSSNTLVAMLCEVTKGRAAELTDVRFYSQRATICEELLHEELCKNVPLPCVPNLLERLNLRRTIADDEQVCEQLVHELKLRGVSSSESEAHVALVAEWDTAYARALPKTFIEAYFDGGSDDEDGEPNGATLENLHSFTYLQGIDGQLPGEQEAPKQVVAREARDEVAAMKRPEGKAQLDHIRRLEGQLKWWDRELKREGGRRRLRAIGILGSDVYDKLLILRALRPNFPGVIFFTTDLDARLLHPDERKWTRNLIVASSFGLRLRKELQGRIPPFRGCYQTSDFFATLLALKPEPWKEDTPCDLSVCQTFNALHALEEHLKKRSRGHNSIAAAVRVYEIARSGAYDLSLREENEAEQEGKKHIRSAHPLSPRDEPWLSWTRLFGILLVLTCLLVLLSFLSQSLRDGLKGPWKSGDKKRDSSAKYRRRLRIAVYAALVSTVALCVVIRLDQAHQDGEPFAVFQGISVWPTELLRLVVFLAGVFCFVAIAHHLAESRKEVEGLLASGERADRGAPSDRQSSDRRSEGPKDPEDKNDATWRRCAWKRFDEFLDIVLPPRKRTTDVRSLWQEYHSREACRHRTIRIVTFLLLYLGIAAPLFICFGPPCFPGRGDWSWWVDRVMLALSVISLILPLFAVLDITRLCGWFVGQLLEPETLRWPDEVRTNKAHERWLLPTDMDEWLSIRLIARHTVVVGKFIYYPFVVWFVMFISRHQVFDRWDWPLPVIAVMMFILLVAVYAAIVLRSSAKRARREALARLRKRVAAALDPERVARLERLISEVENERGGAFSGFTENPVVRAIVLPSGGLGALALLELLSKAF